MNDPRAGKIGCVATDTPAGFRLKRLEVLNWGRFDGCVCALELDGRNGTDELIATGFGAQVVLLSRPPGYGLPGVLATEH